MKKIYLLLLFCCLGNFVFGSIPYAFVNTSPQSWSICQNSPATSINSLIGMTTGFVPATETWSVTSYPSHGSLGGFNYSNAGVISPAVNTPSGLTYRPTPGYSGTDAFTIQVTDGIHTATTTVSVTVNPLPGVYTFTGGGAYCANDPGVHIGLTLSDPGISYQLYNGSSTAGAAVAGTGAAIDFGLYTTVGVYHAVATNTVTTCTSYLSGVTVSINPLPDTFTVTGGGSYCATGAGVHVGLDKSATGINYILYNGSSPAGSAMAGTGSALDFGAQTATGVYTVIGSDAITFCQQAMAGSATVTAIPLPTVETMTGGGSDCQGDAGVHVGLNGSAAGTQYQLYRSGSPVGAAHTGTGAALDFGLQTTGGVYTAIATNTVTTCSAMMSGSVTVTVNPLPTQYNVTPFFANYCIGDTGVHIGLNGSQAGKKYQLYLAGTGAVGSEVRGTGSAITFALVTTGGTYSVTGIDTITGCVAGMNGTARIIATAPVIPSVTLSTNIGAGNAVCLGTLDTFKAHTMNGGGFGIFGLPTFKWTVNGGSVPGTPDSTYAYIPTNGDVITVKLISTAACAMPDTVADTMTIVVDTPLPPAVFIDVTPLTSLFIGQQDTLHAVTTNCGPSPGYQWYKNSTLIAGATNAMYTSNSFVNGDSVCCRVTTSGVCGGRVTFNCVVITVYPTSVTQITGSSDIKLIPNPNKGEFMIKGTLSSVNDENVSVEITNMLGQVIYKNKIMTQNGIISERIQLSNELPNGMYILNLKSENETKVFRFVIEQ